MKSVKLITGTDIFNGKQILIGTYPGMSSWSDNLETAAHYYEGMIIEIEVALDPGKIMDYVRDQEDLDHYKIKPDEYTYGFSEMKCPEGAIWYSFSRKYLEEHVLSKKEICPDLKEFNEED